MFRNPENSEFQKLWNLSTLKKTLALSGSLWLSLALSGSLWLSLSIMKSMVSLSAVSLTGWLAGVRVGRGLGTRTPIPILIPTPSLRLLLQPVSQPLLRPLTGWVAGVRITINTIIIIPMLIPTPSLRFLFQPTSQPSASSSSLLAGWLEYE